jgi:hypothetical protein
MHAAALQAPRTDRGRQAQDAKERASEHLHDSSSSGAIPELMHTEQERKEGGYVMAIEGVREGFVVVVGGITMTKISKIDAKQGMH